MIESITLNSINSSNVPITFYPQTVNVIVGPNSSGKSLFLKELSSLLTHSYGPNGMPAKIIDDITYEKLDLNAAQTIYKKLRELGVIKKGEDVSYNYAGEQERIVYFSNGTNSHMSKNEVIDTLNYSYKINEMFKNPEYIPQFSTYSSEHTNRPLLLEGHQTLLIDGTYRLNILEGETISLYSPDDFQNPYSFNKPGKVYKLYKNSQLFALLRQLIYEVFELYTYIKFDSAKGELVFSKNKLPEHIQEFSFNSDAIEFYSKCMTSNDLSDGQRAYIGIIFEIVAGDPTILLLDEAEAFLHPPLARTLGKVIAEIARTNNKQIFISTHSPNIIMGAIHSEAAINILRLTFDGKESRGTLIDSASLRKMMINPLIRSTYFLEALFYTNVVVTESDSDRVLYSEINHRLQKFKPEWSIPDCLFLHAHSKQIVGQIVENLRIMGIAAASVIDFDFIKEGGKEFSRYLSSVNIPNSLHVSIQTMKTEIKKSFINQNDIKHKGIRALDTDKQLLAKQMLDILKEYGQFPVPCGELEQWLPDIHSHNHGIKWVIQKLESMGEDSSDPEYVKPSDNDIWRFIYEIKQWLTNTNRKGMTSSS